ncbi:hypothetical protein C8T65DRAFT_670404 [Cerioporus squamosus]|nr:hypothetical protein C8T65DRAFT_670404 [Cerioporus squamosus]
MLFITAASLLAIVLQGVFAQDLKMNTLMSATQCGRHGPYYLSLVPAGQAGGQAMRQFPVQNGDSMTWNVDFSSGTSFTSAMRDSTGAQAFSDIQTVQTGPDSSCLGQSGTMSAMSSTVMAVSSSSMMSSAASANSATTPSASGTSRGTSTTSSMSGSSESSTASGTGIHAATSATASSTGTSNAASTPGSAGAIGFAGMLGIIGAAFLG